MPTVKYDVDMESQLLLILNLKQMIWMSPNTCVNAIEVFICSKSFQLHSYAQTTHNHHHGHPPECPHPLVI